MKSCPTAGSRSRFKTWEKDMGLREAIKVSNVAIYQELARRIGLERMREGVRKLGLRQHADRRGGRSASGCDGPLANFCGGRSRISRSPDDAANCRSNPKWSAAVKEITLDRKNRRATSCMARQVGLSDETARLVGRLGGARRQSLSLRVEYRFRRTTPMRRNAFRSAANA